jgi:serine/threonine-protein kinase
MMTGRPPFDGESPVAVAIQHINGKPAMPSTLNPNIPGGLEQIIMRAMAHSAADRYPTAAALLLDMDEFRKDPTILFDYNNPTADMDAATRLGGDSQDSQETAPLPNPQPRRTPSGAGAGGSSGGRSGAPKRRPQGGSGQHSGQNRRPSPRHREEVIEEEEDRSRVATIAIIACVVVVLLAVIILGVVYITNLYQGSMIPVPNLVGMHQDQAMANTDIVVVLDEPIYSDRYEPGYIVSQNPSSGLIAKGGVVRITVSLGPRPSELKMPDLTNVEEQAAKNFLIGQGIKEDHIVVVRQNSATITAGQVISTDPAKDATLSKDQLIRLYVSTGPEVREENMPNVKGMSLDMAVSILNRSGFFNLSYEPVESTFDQNYVVNQSIPAETKINVNTNIVLYYSTGNEATKPTEKPTDPTISTIDPDLKMMVVTIRIPDDVTEAFTLTVWQDSTVVQEMDLPAGTISRQVELTGKGTMTFQFKIGDRLIDEREVNFDE